MRRSSCFPMVLNHELYHKAQHLLLEWHCTKIVPQQDTAPIVPWYGTAWRPLEQNWQKFLPRNQNNGAVG